MATVINITQQPFYKSPLHKVILKKYDKPGRDPEKAIDIMYGLWEDKNIAIKSIRGAKSRKKGQKNARYLIIQLNLCNATSDGKEDYKFC